MKYIFPCKNTKKNRNFFLFFCTIGDMRNNFFLHHKLIWPISENSIFWPPMTFGGSYRVRKKYFSQTVTEKSTLGTIIYNFFLVHKSFWALLDFVISTSSIKRSNSYRDHVLIPFLNHTRKIDLTYTSKKPYQKLFFRWKIRKFSKNTIFEVSGFEAIFKGLNDRIFTKFLSNMKVQLLIGVYTSKKAKKISDLRDAFFWTPFMGYVTVPT